MQPLSVNETQTLTILKTAAAAGEPCPTNADFAMILGYNSRSVPIKVIQSLERRGLITVERYQTARRVTIVETGARTALANRDDAIAPHWTLTRSPSHRRAALPLDIPPPKFCEWPTGEVGAADFHFCGAPAREGHAYCATHYAKAYRPPLEKRIAA